MNSSTIHFSPKAQAIGTTTPDPMPILDRCKISDRGTATVAHDIAEAA
jgi:hypothetical protein